MNDLKILIEKRKAAISKFTYQENEQVPVDRIKTLELWKNYTAYCPPDTFLILHNLKDQEIVQTSGVDQLGFSINSTVDLLQHTHENHKLFYTNHINILKYLSYNYGHTKNQLSMRSFNIRALRKNNGTYQYVKVTSIPVSTNKKGFIHESISWYTPISTYHGQPFKSQLTTIESPSQNNEMVDAYNLLVKESYDYISFTKRQKQIICLLKEGATKSRISEMLDISIRTVEKYKEMILNKGKVLIPVNRFKSADDVVFYLSEMGFI